MEKSCPDCGAETAFVEHTARVLQGSCAACGKTFTVLQEAPVLAGTPDGEGGTAETPESGPAVPRVAGPPCSVCGTAMALRAASDTSLEARCSSCSTTFTYVLATSPFPGPVRSYPPRGRPPREEGSGFGPARSRPCRECGGPLRFSTDAEGNVTGECDSCGNRFTLPPRREFGGGRRDGGDRRRSGRGGPPSFRRGGRYPPGRGGGDERPRYRSAGPPFRRRERRDEDEEDDGPADRRRRRPRRE